MDFWPNDLELYFLAEGRSPFVKKRNKKKKRREASFDPVSEA